MIIKKKVNKQPDVTEEVKIEEMPASEAEAPAEEAEEKPVVETAEEINLFDLDNIDFKQRQERRKGDRRRGFRRIDDRNLISRAREEAETIKESASKEGYEAGLNQAKADLDNFRETLGAFLSAKQEVFEYIAPELLAISVDIAKKIIKKEIQQDPTIILENIVDLLKSLSKEETKVTLRVNPEQAMLVKQKIPEIVELAGSEAKVNIISDENVTFGGCMVTTTNGIIDATIETQMSIISEALKEL